MRSSPVHPGRFNACLLAAPVLLVGLGATVVWLASSRAVEAKAAESPSEGAAKARDLVLDLGSGVSMKLVLIRAGTFIMGSPEISPLDKRLRRTNAEQPLHEVTIRSDFYLGAFEVTRGQFAAFAADTGYKTEAERDGWAFAWDGRKWDKVEGASWRSVGFDQTDDHPVLCVSWADAVVFCDWLTRKGRHPVRLPTETEWEYGCRAGSTAAFCWGDDPKDGKGCCNAADETGRKKYRAWRAAPWDDGYVFTAPVGTFRANRFGLHDMHGNVWEWCSDNVAEPGAGGAAYGGGKREGRAVHRVIRGGSWMSTPGRCRSAFRAVIPPVGEGCDNIVGFRVAADAGPAAGNPTP